MAYITFIRLFVCVHSKMRYHVPGLRKDSVAIIVFADVDALVYAFVFIRVLPNFILVSFEHVIVHHISFSAFSVDNNFFRKLFMF